MYEHNGNFVVTVSVLIIILVIAYQIQKKAHAEIQTEFDRIQSRFSSQHMAEFDPKFLEMVEPLNNWPLIGA